MKKFFSCFLASLICVFGGAEYVFAGGGDSSEAIQIAVISEMNADATGLLDNISNMPSVEKLGTNSLQIGSNVINSRKIRYNKPAFLTTDRHEYEAPIGNHLVAFHEIKIPFTEINNPNSEFLFNSQKNNYWQQCDMVMVVFDATQTLEEDQDPVKGWHDFAFSYIKFIKHNNRDSMLMFVPLNGDKMEEYDRSIMVNTLVKSENDYHRMLVEAGKPTFTDQYISLSQGYRFESILDHAIRDCSIVKSKKKSGSFKRKNNSEEQFWFSCAIL